MKLFILKNPSAQTLLAKIHGDTCPPGYEPSTEAEAAAWVAGQLAAGWAPSPLLEVGLAESRRQSGATVIRRLTDAELVALDASRHPAAIRAKMLAQSEGVISEADPDFAALTDALDALGIIAKARWATLLAA